MQGSRGGIVCVLAELPMLSWHHHLRGHPRAAGRDLPSPREHGAQSSTLMPTQRGFHRPQDLLWAASFYARFFLAYVPFYGTRGALLLYVIVR